MGEEEEYRLECPLINKVRGITRGSKQDTERSSSPLQGGYIKTYEARETEGDEHRVGSSIFIQYSFLKILSMSYLLKFFLMFFVF